MSQLSLLSSLHLMHLNAHWASLRCQLAVELNGPWCALQNRLARILRTCSKPQNKDIAIIASIDPWQKLTPTWPRLSCRSCSRDPKESAALRKKMVLQSEARRVSSRTAMRISEGHPRTPLLRVNTFKKRHSSNRIPRALILVWRQGSHCKEVWSVWEAAVPDVETKLLLQKLDLPEADPQNHVENTYCREHGVYRSSKF